MHRCRNCGATVSLVFADLGTQPLANAFLATETSFEARYPLRAVVCEACWLVQLDHVPPRQAMFTEYPYFSGQSDQWVLHCRALADQLVGRYRPRRVIEIASNDGTLLRQFQASGVTDVLGIEPAYNVAKHAEWAGVPTLAEYWGRVVADLVEPADLIVAQNVLAHVPDLDDFIGGITAALNPRGVVVFEFPWLWRLIEQGQWDTIYHEHHSYLSLTAVQNVLAPHGLYVFGVEEVSTHGGSLRVYAANGGWRSKSGPGGMGLLAFERAVGLNEPHIYRAFSKVPGIERDHARARLCGKQITTVGYGAAAKGVTFLNYCAIGRETITAIVDSTPAKQGKFTPGGRIPIIHPERLKELRPSRIVVLPWNWREEIETKIRAQSDWHPEVLARPFRAQQARLAA